RCVCTDSVSKLSAICLDTETSSWRVKLDGEGQTPSHNWPYLSHRSVTNIRYGAVRTMRLANDIRARHILDREQEWRGGYGPGISVILGRAMVFGGRLSG